MHIRGLTSPFVSLYRKWNRTYVPIQFSNEKTFLKLLKRISHGENFVISIRDNQLVPVMLKDLKRSIWLVYKFKSFFTFKSTKAEFIARLVERNRPLIYDPKKPNAFFTPAIIKKIDVLKDLGIQYASINARLSFITSNIEDIFFENYEGARKIHAELKPLQNKIHNFEDDLIAQREDLPKKIKDIASNADLELKKFRQRKLEASKTYPVVRKIGEKYLKDPKHHDVVLKHPDGSTTTINRKLFERIPNIKSILLISENMECQDGITRKLLPVTCSQQSLEIALQYVYGLEPWIAIYPDPENLLGILSVAQFLRDKSMEQWGAELIEKHYLDPDNALELCYDDFMLKLNIEANAFLIEKSIQSFLSTSSFEMIPKGRLKHLHPIAVYYLINKSIWIEENVKFNFVKKWAQACVDDDSLSVEEMNKEIRDLIHKPEAMIGNKCIADTIQTSLLNHKGLSKQDGSSSFFKRLEMR
jgi:hypothetical protein